MKQTTFGKFALLGAVALAGCYSYASQDINNGTYNTVQADPNFQVISVGDSDQVLVRLVNAANNGAITSYTVSNSSSGIAVHYNANYRPYYNSKTDTLQNQTDKDQQQYQVVGLVPGVYTFTLTPTSVNTKVSATVTVVVTPHDLGNALNKSAVTSGDTITITAPPGTVFTPASAITVNGATVAILSRAADSSAITFAIADTSATKAVNAPVTVSNVGVAGSPGTQTGSFTTTDSLTAPVLAGATMTGTPVNPGDTVTITVPSFEAFTDSSVVSFSAGPNGAVVSRQPQTLKVLVGPGDSGSAKVTNVQVATAASLGNFTLSAPGNIHVANVAVAPTTVSNAAPNIGENITVTLGGSLRFTKNSNVFIGGTEAGIVSTSADSSSAVVTPMAYSSGSVTYKGIVLSFLNSVALNVNGDKSVTVGNTYAGPTDPNANSVATASTLHEVGAQSFVVSDNGTMVTPCNSSQFGGGALCRYYKITIPAGVASGDLVWDTGTTADMGAYLMMADGTTCAADVGDANGPTPGNVGEHLPTPYNCAYSNSAYSIPAGSYVLVIMVFGGSPPPVWYQFRMSQP